LPSQDWDIRVNGYVPLNDRELVSSSEGEATVEVIGSSIFLIPGDATDLYEIAMWGVYANPCGGATETEIHLWTPPGTQAKSLENTTRSRMLPSVRPHK
jgi:hypothetical protein